MPVIADERVEREFGTGALKVTPGHDPIDFEIGRDHGLPEPTVIGLDGRMTGDVPGELVGSRRTRRPSAWSPGCASTASSRSARATATRVGHCERSGTRIQPLVSLQWWCSMDELARPAIEAIESGRVTFHPPSAAPRRDSTGSSDAPDWNMSRQLWWGHQLPIWYCPDGHVDVRRDRAGRLRRVRLARARRATTDVLDTWFSSALWPFATLGWPDETPELRRSIRATCNSTAREIIRLWENRMIFAGLELWATSRSTT